MSNPYRKIASGQPQPIDAPRRMEVRPNTKVASKHEETLFEGDGTFNPQ